MTRILVIEDAPEVLDNIVDTLEAARYEVLGVSDGNAGLSSLNRSIPDLVICDVMMPGISGYDVLRRIRENESTATLPVIMLTARGERESLRKGMELGADDYITKPFTQNELLNAIETQLRKQEVTASKLENTMKLLRMNIIYALPHELRTPLHLIGGYAEMLAMDYDTAEREEILGIAKTIIGASRRLQRLIENYLVYAQLEVMTSDPTMRDALRNHLLEDSREAISQKAMNIAQKHQRSDDLSLDLCASGLIISTENLEKIIEELVDNAFKFSEPGSLVSVKSVRNEHHFTLTIRDFGRGMSQEDIKRVGAYMQFDRAFYEQQGLGLGFAIAKKLIELHDGELRIKSTPEQGTLLGIRFPI